MKKIASFFLLFVLLAPCGFAAQVDFEDGQVSIHAHVDAPEGLTEARSLVCEGLRLEDESLLAAFGMPDAEMANKQTHSNGSEYHVYVDGDACLETVIPTHYSYERGSVGLLRGYTRARDYVPSEDPDSFYDNETIKRLEQAGLLLAVRRYGSQTGQAIREQMREEKEDLEWEKEQKGIEWHEEDILENAKVSRYECVQVVEQIPLFQFAREIDGIDSIINECEAIIYCADDEIIYFSGGVFSDPQEYGEYLPLISAEEATRAFAEDYNMLIGMQNISCDTVRLEYMAFPEPGYETYTRWRMEPAWVFYGAYDSYNIRIFGGVHALTGEVLAL